MIIYIYIFGDGGFPCPCKTWWVSNAWLFTRDLMFRNSNDWCFAKFLEFPVEIRNCDGKSRWLGSEPPYSAIVYTSSRNWSNSRTLECSLKKIPPFFSGLYRDIMILIDFLVIFCPRFYCLCGRYVSFLEYIGAQVIHYTTVTLIEHLTHPFGFSRDCHL